MIQLTKNYVFLTLCTLFQFIIGVGIPVDLKEASITVGTVVKFQYDLPTNSSEYTTRIYGFANTVAGRDMVDEQENIEEDDSTHSVMFGEARNDVGESDNDTLVDITFSERRKRSLMYSEGGTGNDIDEYSVNTELPLQEAIRRQELLDRKRLEDDEEPQRMNRWDFYKIMEKMLERYLIT